MPDQLFELISQPGVRRDGTALDSPFYNDGVWVRWQRGKPRKMGGYRAMSTLANGPVRSILVDSRNAINSVHSFSPWGIQRLQFSASGAGGNLEDRTPLGFTPDQRLTWSHGIMASSTGGSFSALLAASAPDVDQIDSDETGFLYSGNMADSSPLQIVEDGAGPIQVSGGCCVLQPFLFVYGSNGLIRNTNANDFSAGTGWTGTFANEANVAGTKFVHGAPVRGGGQSPAGLFWALDALVRVSFNNDPTTIWSYDTLSSPTSILSKKGIVEHDGKFYWPGTDRFLFYNGVVQELPNQMNSNWFFENLNYAKRNKVWGTKIPRWGEIWWFYPRGEADECDHAVIFNYIEGTWYDAKKERTAGGQVQLFPFPLWAGHEDSQNTTVLTIGIRLANSAQTALGNATLTFVSTTGVVDGMLIEGAGVDPGATVVSHTLTTVLMSAVSTAIIPIGTTITFSSMNSPFIKGDLVTGGTTAATGEVVRSSLTELNLIRVTGAFDATEVLTGPHSAEAVSSAEPFEQVLDTLYQQEIGVDKIIGGDINAIEASFTSKDFGFAVGQPFLASPTTVDITTVLARIEPDFSQTGDLTMTTQGRSFPNDPIEDVVTTVLPETGPFEDIRDAQARILRVKITSNVRGGTFDQGKVMLTLKPGDERSSEVIGENI
jgi:hypothetical protein